MPQPARRLRKRPSAPMDAAPGSDPRGAAAGQTSACRRPDTRNLLSVWRPNARQSATSPRAVGSWCTSRFLATVVMGLALNALYLWLGRLLPLVVAHWALDFLLLGLLPLIA